MEICFVLSQNWLYCAMEMELWLSSKNFQYTSGFRRLMSKINNISLMINIKSIILCIAWLNTTHYASVALKQIHICSLLYLEMGQPAYTIAYIKHDMKVSTLLGFVWSQPPGKSAFTYIWFIFIYKDDKLLHKWINSDYHPVDPNTLT